MTTAVIRHFPQLNNSPRVLRPSNSNSSENSINHQDLEIIKKIDKGKFPVYLANSKTDNQKYVMKVFSNAVKDSQDYYENEIRFASLNHPNIIKIVDYEKEKTLYQKGIFMNLTYVVSEYAPHGDFFDFVIKHRSEIDDKLVRTYFRQLIEGLEYLHSLGVSHLDLKPENLLLGADFNLKIADFDLSHVTGDEEILSKGTKFYRPPEVYNNSSDNFELAIPSAVDIYGAGIILFILKSGGVYPHAENRMIGDVNLTELMHKNHRNFWSTHCKLQGKEKSFFDSKFKSLFSKMVKADPKKRASLKKIKKSKWYNGPVYTPQELTLKMKTILQC